MPRTPPPRPPRETTPVFRVTGKSTEVVFADGTVAPAKQVDELVRWTACGEVEAAAYLEGTRGRSGLVNAAFHDPEQRKALAR